MILNKLSVSDGATPLMYNFSTREINMVGTDIGRLSINGDCPSIFMRLKEEAITPPNTSVFAIEAVHLCDLRDRLKRDLQKIASTIKEEDNPVLMIAKFKSVDF